MSYFGHICTRTYIQQEDFCTSSTSFSNNVILYVAYSVGKCCIVYVLCKTEPLVSWLEKCYCHPFYVKKSEDLTAEVIRDYIIFRDPVGIVVHNVAQHFAKQVAQVNGYRQRRVCRELMLQRIQNLNTDVASSFHLTASLPAQYYICYACFVVVCNNNLVIVCFQ